ncbi:hypothetical protein JD276_15330 [Leucobacter sp. CSA1]|uniref:Uncharacterized protein n=1 Tax=Leucobacter chromiisoli TaxID=2796471 RepID=A0A934QAP0_9MICO|nr:hypothetical protein [Leucobacter chromiisoli]MBK0420400.1 hypothetical protein [Leucobacter chromiisoli]
MDDRVVLKDESLAAASAALAVATLTMAGGGAAPSVSLRSLTGIGEQVARFLQGVEIARHSLADAARAADLEVAGARQAGDELDTRIGRSLSPGFGALRGAP